MMSGIRVCNIAKTVQDRHLRIHFSKPEHGGGHIRHIYYPLHNNDAVILYQNAAVVDTVCSMRQVIKEQELQIQRLPDNMMFGRVSARLEEAASVLMQVSPALVDELRYTADLLVEQDAASHTYTLTGGWYQLEWAWHYLDCFMQQQEVIQSEIQNQPQRSAHTPMDTDIADTETLQRSPRGQHGDQQSASSPLRAGSPYTSIAPDDASLRKVHVARNSRRERLKDPVPRSHKNSGPKSMKGPRSQTYDRLGFNQHSSGSEIDKQEGGKLQARETDVDSDITYLKAIGGPAERSLSYQQAVTESPAQQRSHTGSPRQQALSTDSDDDLDLTGKPHDIPFESVHSTLNLEKAKHRHSDENDTFEQFSGLDLNNHKSHVGEIDVNVMKVSSAQLSANSKHDLRVDQTQSQSTHDRLNEQYLTDRTCAVVKELVTSAAAAADSPAGQRLPDRYSDDQLQFQFEVGGISVFVYFGSLVKEETECIVNAANSNLVHAGGVAYAIAQAAGPDLDRECEEYVRQHGELDVAAVTHTAAGGRLKAHHILHTVGPMWSEVFQERVIWQLTRTFLNCLHYAEKMWLRSLAFPAISSGVYGVPLDICVRCFLDALLVFVSGGESRRLVDVRLVNNDAEASVTSIVLIQTLLDTGVEALTAEAIKSHTKFRSRELNLPRGRPERSNSFSPTDVRDAWSADLYTDRRCEQTSVKGKQPVRRSVSLGRLMDKQGSGRTHDHDSGLSRSPALDSHSGVRERGRDATVKSSAQSRSSQYTAGNTTATTKSVSTRSSKRPSTADMISRATPTLKKSLLTSTAPVRLKSRKASELLLTSRVAGHGAEAGVHTQVDYELGMHSLPADLNKHSFREKFLQLSQPQETETCVICLEKMKRPKTLTKCKHMFCTACIDEHFARAKPTCPQCGMMYGALRGDQPKEGRMTYITKRDLYLPGHEREDGTIIITYTFPDGKQDLEHPSPGKAYSGLRRKAYLPNSVEGREVLRLLKTAFDARLIFTIGESRTSGQHGVLTWNDIHHKTSVYGGSTDYGYPDQLYLKRVKSELAAKGITNA